MGRHTKTRVTKRVLISTLSEMDRVERQLERLYERRELSTSPKVKALEDKLTRLDDVIAQASDRTWDSYLSSCVATDTGGAL